MKNRKRLLAAGFAAVLLAGVIVWRPGTQKAGQPKEVKIQLAYPIKSLDPTYSKDWETVSINNHIFTRLVPTQHASKAPFVASRVDFSCVLPEGSPLKEGCQNVKISFEPKLFKDCMGRQYTTADIQKEFEAIIKSTPWILPKSKPCDDGPGRVCLVGTYRPDVQRRMHSVTLRFGWSKQKKEDPQFGSGPYCLTAKTRSEQGITEGFLTPKKEYSDFPEIHFMVSQDPKSEFHFALYGSKNLLVGNRKNIQAHTPIGYYVVTNPALVGNTVPWNLEQTKKAISDTFLREEVFFPTGSNITNIFPAGSAVTDTATGSYPKKALEFVLPDYLPKCQELAASLTQAWKKFGNAKAVCKDVVSFVYNHVWNPKRDWDGFIVGVTQHDPGRNTVEYEYFSPDSPDSWIYDYPKPKQLYYLAGVGQSIVTVDGERFCGLRPNLFGLGDIFVTDLLPCKQGWLAE